LGGRRNLDREQGRVHHRLRLGRPVVLAALTLALAACAITRQEPLLDGPGLQVRRVTGDRPATVAPDPRTRDLTRLEVEASLRRIVVDYHGAVSFISAGVRPLLSESQVKSFGQVLHRELSTLQPNQRVRFRFRDAKQNFAVEMDVYPDGANLVYAFLKLVEFPGYTPAPGEMIVPGADLVPQPGQEATRRAPLLLKDPVVAEEAAQARGRADRLALVDVARADGVIDAAEQERLRALVDGQPRIPLDAWRAYWDQRRTLKKALEQQIVDEAAYRVQLERIQGELNR